MWYTARFPLWRTLRIGSVFLLWGVIHCTCQLIHPAGARASAEINNATSPTAAAPVTRASVCRSPGDGRTDGRTGAYWTHSARPRREAADPLGSGSDPFDPCLEVTPICSTWPGWEWVHAGFFVCLVFFKEVEAQGRWWEMGGGRTEERIRLGPGPGPGCRVMEREE